MENILRRDIFFDNDLVILKIPVSIIRSLQKYISKASSHFIPNTSEANTRINIDKTNQMLTINSRDQNGFHKLFFTIRNIEEIEIEGRETKEIAINLDNFEVELSTKTLKFEEDALIFSVGNGGMGITTELSKDGSILSYVSRGVMLYNESFIANLREEQKEAKWAFHLKERNNNTFRSAINKIDNCPRYKDSHFKLVKHSSFKVNLEFGSSPKEMVQITLEITNDKDNFPNFANLKYSIHHVNQFLRLLNLKKFLYFEIDENCTLTITQVENELTVSSKFENLKS
jgi:hypothetical protein